MGAAQEASVTVTRRIQWAETDASGWYHNTAVLLLIEEAEHVLLDRLGILHEVIARIPRVRIEVDFRRVLRFWDEVEVALAVQEVGESSITYRFEVRSGEEVCAEGKVVAVQVADDGKPAPWSDEHRRLLRTAGARG